MQYLIPLLALLAAPVTVHEWDFTDPGVRATWVANVHLTDTEASDGTLHGRSTDWDPFWVCDGLEIPARPCQAVVFTIRASKAGECDLFWTGDVSGPNGGLSEDRKADFSIPEADVWSDIAVFPGWEGAGVIRKLRFDVYNGSDFDISRIRVVDWSNDSAPVAQSHWNAEALAAWYASPDGVHRWSPPLNVDTTEAIWATVEVQSENGGTGAFVWTTPASPGEQRQSFSLEPGLQTCNIELDGIAEWRDVSAIGLYLPGASVVAKSLTLGSAPGGPANLRMTYFGAENGVNRVGAPARITAQFTNRGGEAIALVQGTLQGPESLTISPLLTTAKHIGYEDRAILTWTIQSDVPGDIPLTLTLEGAGQSLHEEASIVISARPDVPKADYVPAPIPVETSTDVAAYYFPGWDSPAKWDPVQRVAPIRKPVLGWYDEANPEIVDWQIKWAVENGISVFLVDWYWIQGSQHLQHWIEAYRKSKYRDQLKIALMWANHNPPGTHSAEDWKRVSDHWVAEYFSMESYYQIGGKPAFFLWDHRNLRNDLGGSEAVAKALADSRESARAAGFEGIHYVALHPFGDEPKLQAEGYDGITRYHEWGNAQALAKNPMHLSFADVAETVAASWQQQYDARAGLTFYPVVDSGWDSRPWHGNEARVISGRTPALFERMLKEAKAFAEKTEAPLVILGPMNEWGEGSYLEPNTEFGFAMMNAVRNVFGKGDPAGWPPNMAPFDVGLGPYDFPEPEKQFLWTFDTGPEGWRAMMGFGEAEVKEGALTATASTRDPALVLPLHAFKAKEVSGFRVRMQLTGDLPDAMRAQVFWTRGGESTSEAASVRFDLKTDGNMHEYTVPFGDNPRWRGEITTLRFDPCSVQGATLRMDEFELLKAPPR